MGSGLLISVMVIAPIEIWFTYAQLSSSGNSTSNNTFITISPAKKTVPYMGDSIKLIVVSSLVDEDQWKPIDNYTSHGWELKAMLPYIKRFIVVLEKEEAGNETRP